MKIKRDFLDLDLFKKLINEIKDLHLDQLSSIRELHFSYDGEPFMHPNYIEMLSYIDQNIKDLKVIIHTNASLLNEEKIHSLLSLSNNYYYLVIALDASYRELYEKIHVGGNYYTVEKNLRYLLECKKQGNITNPCVILQFIVMPENEHDQNNFYWKWEPFLGPVRKASDYTWWEGLNDDNSAQIYWKKMTIWADYEISEYKFDNKDITKDKKTCFHPYLPNRNAHICARPWKSICIASNGGVGFCSFHWEGHGLLGNIKNESLQQIFEGKEAEKLRLHFWKNDFENMPVCGNCDKRDWWYDSDLEYKLKVHYSHLNI